MMKQRANARTPDATNITELAAVHNWWVYIIQCDDGSLYTGVSTDPERRFREHRQDSRGAKYFNGRQPLTIVYTESGHTRSTASQREASIKRLNRSQKLCLISGRNAGQSE
jgi:putative endonuclease